MEVHLYTCISQETLLCIRGSEHNPEQTNITVIMDGLHNNGGWHVEESVEEVNRMISEQLD